MQVIEYLSSSIMFSPRDVSLWEFLLVEISFIKEMGHD